MNLMQKSLSALGATAMMACLAFGTAGVANATTVTVGFDNVTGTVAVGSASTGPGDLTGVLDTNGTNTSHSGDDSALINSTNPVTFDVSITGDVTGTPVGDLSGAMLSGSTTFGSGSDLVAWLTGNTYTSFSDVALTATLGGNTASLPVTDGVGKFDLQGGLSNQGFFGGIFTVSGNQSTLAGLGSGEFGFENGTATITATTGAAAAVPAPAGLAMLLFMGFSLLGFTLVVRRRKRTDKDDETMPAVAV